MTLAEERAGRFVAAAMRAIGWCAAITDEGLGGARVEVRHPEDDGGRLCAIVRLSPIEVSYAEPMYRAGIERTVSNAVLRAEAVR